MRCHPRKQLARRAPVVLLSAFLLFPLAMLVSLAPVAASAAAPQPNTIVVDLSVPIDPGSAALMNDAVTMAQSEHAPAIVIQMNTPGGLLSDMTDMIASIQQANESGIPTYAYVPSQRAGGLGGELHRHGQQQDNHGRRVGDRPLDPDRRRRV